MGLDSCKLIKGRIPDSLQSRPLWHCTFTSHSLKFLLCATTEGVPTRRRGGGESVRTPQSPAFRSPLTRPNTDNFAEIAGVGGGEREGEKREGWGDEAEPSSPSRRPSGLQSRAGSPRSPLHPINGNSPHFLLWRLGLVGCLGSASVGTCAREGCAGRDPEAPGRAW